MCVCVYVCVRACVFVYATNLEHTPHFSSPSPSPSIPNSELIASAREAVDPGDVSTRRLTITVVDSNREYELEAPSRSAMWLWIQAIRTNQWVTRVLAFFNRVCIVDTLTPSHAEMQLMQRVLRDAPAAKPDSDAFADLDRSQGSTNRPIDQSTGCFVAVWLMKVMLG